MITPGSPNIQNSVLSLLGSGSSLMEKSHDGHVTALRWPTVDVLCAVAAEIKPCPRCGAFIMKMDDGSCNHMTCAVCGVEFCWLCMKEISDLHYLR